MELTQVGDEVRGAAADLDVPGNTRVERDLSGTLTLWAE
jgi:hypothetical protein